MTVREEGLPTILEFKPVVEEILLPGQLKPLHVLNHPI